MEAEDFYPVLKSEGGKYVLKYMDADEISELNKVLTLEGSLHAVLTTKPSEDCGYIYRAYYRRKNKSHRAYNNNKEWSHFITSLKTTVLNQNTTVTVIKATSADASVPLFINSDDPLILKLQNYM